MDINKQRVETSDKTGKANELSVLMSIYSDPIPLIKIAIESVLNQTYKKFQFVIVNNNPGDESLRLVLKEYARSDRRILVVENSKHTLLSESLNNGLQAVTGKYVARMDADDIALPDRLELQLAFLRANANITLVGGNVILIDEDGNEMSSLRRPVSNRLITIYHKYGVGGCVMHPTWMGKAEFFSSLGGYRNSLSNTEDYDLLLRGSISGFRYANIGKPVLKYRIRQGLSVQNIASQMRYAKLLRKLFLSGQLDDAEVVSVEINRLKQKLQDCSGRETEALLQLYEFKSKLASRNLWSASKSLIKAVYLAPVLSFDVVLRNSVLNKILVMLG